MITYYHSWLTQGESSRTGELSTVMEQRAYNLRSQKEFDSVTIQRRLEFARRRELQTQRKNERKRAETLEQEKIRAEILEREKISETLEQEKIREYMKRASKRMKEMIDKLPKRGEVDLEDLENRSECLSFHFHHVSFLS